MKKLIKSIKDEVNSETSWYAAKVFDGESTLSDLVGQSQLNGVANKYCSFEKLSDSEAYEWIAETELENKIAVAFKSKNKNYGISLISEDESKEILVEISKEKGWLGCEFVEMDKVLKFGEEGTNEIEIATIEKIIMRGEENFIVLGENFSI